ncbi:MAG TPA: cupredoxin domain-containing protein [Nitrososphaerales archaeon]|nr:cupredoxin domain-containing protein [Nitrososphaerales archaeon]
MSGSTKSTRLAGVVISILVIAAVGSIGYFQQRVAPQLYAATSTSASSTSSGLPPPGHYVNVTIPSGAATPPTGYAPNSKTQYGFSPDAITVVIGVNSTVFWNNQDSAPHTATSDTAGAFDTGTIPPGASAEVTFTTPGTYTYHCTFHSWMQGTVFVKSG